MVSQNNGTMFFNQEKLRRGGPHNNASNEEHNIEYITIAGIITEPGKIGLRDLSTRLPPLSQFPPNTGHCMTTPRCCTRVAAVTISATQDQPMSLQQSLLKPHADRQPRGAAFKLVVADAVNWPQDCATIHHNDSR